MGTTGGPIAVSEVSRLQRAAPVEPSDYPHRASPADQLSMRQCHATVHKLTTQNIVSYNSRFRNFRERNPQVTSSKYSKEENITETVRGYISFDVPAAAAPPNRRFPPKRRQYVRGN
ncbi:hypothetical protein O0L34_g9674 [Tuta absoluta]|nr:hypothetical protein O0L34_g9674 [Tuta absoluta]